MITQAQHLNGEYLILHIFDHFYFTVPAVQNNIYGSKLQKDLSLSLCSYVMRFLYKAYDTKTSFEHSKNYLTTIMNFV